MTIQAVTMYRAVCDCCGMDDGASDTAEDARALLDDDWTVSDDGTVRCDDCHDHDRYEACERDGGHVWDTDTNAYLADVWTGGNDGEPSFRLRYCGNCRRMERQDLGSGWHGYRHGQWLGDLQEAP